MKEFLYDPVTFRWELTEVSFDFFECCQATEGLCNSLKAISVGEGGTFQVRVRGRCWQVNGVWVQNSSAKSASVMSSQFSAADLGAVPGIAWRWGGVVMDGGVLWDACALCCILNRLWFSRAGTTCKRRSSYATLLRIRGHFPRFGI